MNNTTYDDKKQTARQSESQFLDRIRDALLNGPYATPKTQLSGDYIQGLRCPACGRHEAWAYAPIPSIVHCPRENKCGTDTSTRTLFPDLFINIERDYRPTEDDPARPARVYLESRGLNGSLKDVEYTYRSSVRNLDTGAVMFHVSGKIWNGRLLNPPLGENKSHNQGPTRGVFWKHPKIHYTGPVYVVEGIIDALSLIEMGFPAIAVLSANTDPEAFDLSEFPSLILAFDNDTAGWKAFRRWKNVHPAAQAIAPPRGKDWNNLLCDGIGHDRFERTEYEFNARLMLAENADDYAEIWDGHKGYPPGLFDFEGEMFYAGKNSKDELTCTRVGNFTLTVNHFDLDTSDPESPQNRFALRITPKGGRPIACTVTADDLANPSGMDKTFLGRARVVWEGDRVPTKALLRQITGTNATVVRRLHSVGYDDESGCYIFKGFAIGPDGTHMKPGKNGFYTLPMKTVLAPASHPFITPEGGDPRRIALLLYDAWGERAVVALSWVCAAWFVHLIRPSLGFFPFLSFYGDTQTGKTALVRMLNTIQGIDEEGLPMGSTNTAKGEIRKLAQRSSVFKALLEAQADHRGRFDLDTLLTLYNEGNPLQTRAQTTNDLQTNDVPFRSALMFAQNNEPFRSKAQKERVISVPFSAESLTEETAKAFNELRSLPQGHFPSVMLRVMGDRKKIEAEWRTWYDQAKRNLLSIGDARIAEVHAVVQTFAEHIALLFDLPDPTEYIRALAKAKMKACQERMQTSADIFLDTLEQLERDAHPGLEAMMIKDSGRLYVNLPEALRMMQRHGYQTPQAMQLQHDLQNHEAYVEHNKVKKIGNSPLRTWVFDMEKLEDVTHVTHM